MFYYHYLLLVRMAEKGSKDKCNITLTKALEKDRRQRNQQPCLGQNVGGGGVLSIKEVPGDRYFELGHKGRMNRTSIISNMKTQKHILGKMRKRATFWLNSSSQAYPMLT